MGAPVTAMAMGHPTGQPDRPVYAYRWRMRAMLPERRGQLCRKVAIKAEVTELVDVGQRPRSLIVVEFTDGTRVTAPMTAIRKSWRAPILRTKPKSASIRDVVSYEGRQMTIMEAARLAGLEIRMVMLRIRRGENPVRALARGSTKVTR